ncbi:hypothetical protein PV04_03742 [Phialophora macrospora]|uniref:Uncharacterized protein n=1 Tax=Phialophora macrospora TaxID=1851006 RepID=A0A0D2FT88_9EURO|nr:hypothetical protein PV04_03742 [Phialophora macrospora]
MAKASSSVNKVLSGTLSHLPFDSALSLEKSLTYVPATTGQMPPRLEPAEARLPGHPAIRLRVSETGTLFDFLRRELCTPDLDRMSPYLGLVAKQSSAHVTPLHAQLVRGRSVVLCENPELHLLWIHERIFIKPLPPYMLSCAFWRFYLVDDASGAEPTNRAAVLAAAIGFMRTYCLLIQYESDFRLAKTAGLLPEVAEDFTRFIDFISVFATMDDSTVSGRYHFGELRLGRLNFWARIFLRRWHLHKIHWAYSTYFAQFYGPLLFAFGVLSLFLSAMQVIFAAALPSSWEVFSSVARVFSVLVLIFLLTVCALLMALFMSMALREIFHASRDFFQNRARKRKTTQGAA